MRYLGNKDSILHEIEEIVKIQKLKKGKVFFDAFSGTASVGNHFKNKFKIIANDNLYLSFVYSYGKLNNPSTKFEKLGLNPFDYFNEPNIFLDGFVYKNYSPGGSNRMYFSEENAGRIDFIRAKIEEWKKEQLLTDDEYYYLIGSLLESVSKVANVAGVYGSFLKKWDSRAVKTMKFIPIEDTKESTFRSLIYNAKIEDIIEDIECDILYLDPPYTINQYSTQYHVLETIAKYDNPNIKGVTGARCTKNTSSDWSRNGRVEILFDKIISKTQAKHIILSYSSKGLMSKEYIETVLKRYGIEESILFKKIPYKKYLNHRTSNEDDNYEYIFYVEKKEKKDIFYNSPLNYIGNKFNIIEFIFNNMPSKYEKFIDLFGGGFNVGINADAKTVIYNDVNFKVKQLLEMFRDEDTYDLYKYLTGMIKKHGLEKNAKEPYMKVREMYNHPEPPMRDPKLLYLLILYGFNQQIRFNSNHDFNNPVGESSFNHFIFEKLISFSRVIKEKKAIFRSDDFEELISEVDKNTIVYCDPPYLITLGSYNDGKRGFNGWNETDEKRLLNFLDRVDSLKGKFMLSNVLEHKGQENTILIDWLNQNQNRYFIKHYDGNNSRNRREIIITNYSI